MTTSPRIALATLIAVSIAALAFAIVPRLVPSEPIPAASAPVAAIGTKPRDDASWVRDAAVAGCPDEVTDRVAASTAAGLAARSRASLWAAEETTHAAAAFAPIATANASAVAHAIATPAGDLPPVMLAELPAALVEESERAWAARRLSEEASASGAAPARLRWLTAALPHLARLVATGAVPARCFDAAPGLPPQGISTSVQEGILRVSLSRGRWYLTMLVTDSPGVPARELLRHVLAEHPSHLARAASGSGGLLDGLR